MGRLPNSQEQPAHTPGPWRAIADEGERLVGAGMALVSTGYAPLQKRIAIDCTNSGGSYEEDCANARLIAAAPDLLAALEACLKDLTGVPFGHEKQAREAIAKARGAA